MTPDETYVGDGLYASFDGWQLCLRAPREDGDHVVYLEPEVWLALCLYVRGSHHPGMRRFLPAANEDGTP